MKRSRITFLLAELVIALLAIFFIYKIFEGEPEPKTVAVILQNSGDSRWDALINGMKQAAGERNLHLIICNTDDMENAEDEEEIITEQLANGVDAFIIGPAPGTDTLGMLKRVCVDTPYILVTEDVYSENVAEKSGLPVVKPDNYELGYQLAVQMAKNDADGLSGKTVGVVAGFAETEAAENKLKGLVDGLEEYGCSISWQYNVDITHYTYKVVDARDRVDYLAVLDNGALEELADKAENGRYDGAKLYGIGSSEKNISYLDQERICCLIVPDGYGIGYDSVKEVAEGLNSAMYTMRSSEAQYKILYREDLFSEEVERFLYSYE